MVRLRKALVILLLCGFAAWLLFFCWAHLSYASSLPTAPNQKEGRVYQMSVNHGSVRYGTEREIRTLRWAENSQMLAIVFVVAAIILRVRYDDWKQGSGSARVSIQAPGRQRPPEGGQP